MVAPSRFTRSLRPSPTRLSSRSAKVRLLPSSTPLSILTKACSSSSPPADEAQESLVLLCEIFPTFASIKSVDRQDWLTLRRDARAVEVKQRVAQELAEVRERSGAYA